MGVAVIGPIGEQDLAPANVRHHIGRAACVMGLAFGELQQDGQAVGVHYGMDPDRSPRSKSAPHIWFQ